MTHEISLKGGQSAMKVSQVEITLQNHEKADVQKNSKTTQSSKLFVKRNNFTFTKRNISIILYIIRNIVLFHRISIYQSVGWE